MAASKNGAGEWRMNQWRVTLDTCYWSFVTTRPSEPGRSLGLGHIDCNPCGCALELHRPSPAATASRLGAFVNVDKWRHTRAGHQPYPCGPSRRESSLEPRATFAPTSLTTRSSSSSSHRPWHEPGFVPNRP